MFILTFFYIFNDAIIFWTPFILDNYKKFKYKSLNALKML